MARVQSIRSRVAKRSKEPSGVHRFLIVLKGTDPLVWRRIQVPKDYSFWDLHVAIPGRLCLAGTFAWPASSSGPGGTHRRRCPPEDCGGVHGYVEFLEAVADPKHPDHQEMREWAGPFDPDDFNPAKVRFDDPRKRWKKAFRDA